MVAKTSIADRFVPPPEPWIAGRWRVPQFTRADAEAMTRIGVIPDDATTELLHGVIVLKDRSAPDQDPTMISPGHRKCVERLSALRKVIDADTRHVESQQPLVCSDIHQPEPDFVVLRGNLDDYAELANAADAFCVVEVAESSYERDQGIKLYGYARANVAQYVIINLRNRTAEVYTSPDAAAGAYATPLIVAADQSLGLRVGEHETFTVKLADVLP